MITNIGPLEIGILVLLALLLFGPKLLPELGKSLGQTGRELRNVVTQVRGGEESQEERLGKASAGDASEPAG